MKATTIKLEGELLRNLEIVKPDDLSLSAFVRQVLLSELRRRAMAASANEYREFLAKHPEEAKWLHEWESADLASAPEVVAP
jgi:hypothetical protein